MGGGSDHCARLWLWMGATGALVPVQDVTSVQLWKMNEVLCRVEYMEARVAGFYTGDRETRVKHSWSRQRWALW